MKNSNGLCRDYSRVPAAGSRLGAQATAGGTIVAQAPRHAESHESKMSERMKNSLPSRRPFGPRFAAEQSGVRERPDGIADGSARRRVEASRESVGERSHRIGAKIAEAHALLQQLPPTDPRLRLLCSAILRKDEVLLDAVLRTSGKRPV
jgi:hypothetical protein